MAIRHAPSAYPFPRFPPLEVFERRPPAASSRRRPSSAVIGRHPKTFTQTEMGALRGDQDDWIEDKFRVIGGWDAYAA
jgi:hypothetical protein